MDDVSFSERDSGASGFRRDYVLSVMTFALRIGEEMLESSVATSEVESELRRLLGAFGLVDCEASVTLNVVTLCFLTSDEPGPVTLMKVVEVSEPRLDRLAALEGLIRRVESGELSIAAASAEVDRLDSSAPPYPDLVRTAAGVISVLAWVTFAGGGFLGAAAGMAAALAMAAIAAVTHTRRVPSVFVLAVCAAVAVAAPMAFAAAGLPIALAPAITGGLYPLLPGGLLVASVTDGLGGSPVSSLAKGLEAAFVATAVAFGVLAALSISAQFGVTSSVVPSSASFTVALVAAVVAVGALAVSRSLPARFVVVASLVAAVAFAVSRLPLGGPEGLPLSTFAAAALIGLGGQLAGRFFGTTAALHTTSAVYTLVPGLSFFLGVQAFAEGSTAAGVDQLVTALGIAIAVAAGIAAGAAAGRTVPSPRARVKVWLGAAKVPALRLAAVLPGVAVDQERDGSS